MVKGKRFLSVLLVAVLAGTALFIFIWALRSGMGTGSLALSTLSLTDLLAGSPDSTGPDGGYAKALAPRPFSFPADHGPHPDFRNEWWYFTGNLRDKRGKEFGYQLTFFRSALAPRGRDTARISPWASRQVYMAHLAVTELGSLDGGAGSLGNGSFQAYERFSRGALGLAGSEISPFHVWLEDWKCESLGGDTSFFPLRLRAAQGSLSIDLILEEGKRMVLQGEAGFSRKGPGEGNASYYYSYTRMPTHGTIKTSAGDFEAGGNSWMDREWGSSILASGIAGWDWFGLQLSDSTDLLFFRLRSSQSPAGGTGPVRFDYGMLIDSHGVDQVLQPEDMRAEILSLWKSPRGRVYPARWRMGIPSRGLKLEISPKRSDQELNLSIPYWEGAVDIKAERTGQSLAGEGYMELTGYR